MWNSYPHPKEMINIRHLRSKHFVTNPFVKYFLKQWHDEYEILVFPLVAQESQVTEIYRTSTLTNKPQNMGLHCYVTYREVHILNCRIT